MRRALGLLVLASRALKASAGTEFALSVRDENRNDVSHLFSVYHRNPSTTGTTATQPASLSRRFASSVYCRPDVNGVPYQYAGSKCDQSLNALAWDCFGYNVLVEPQVIVQNGDCDLGQVCIDNPSFINLMGVNGRFDIVGTSAECIDIFESTTISLTPGEKNLFYEFEQDLSQAESVGSNTFDVFFVNPTSNATISMNWINIVAEDEFHTPIVNAMCYNCGFDQLGPIPKNASRLTVDASLPSHFTTGALYVAFGLLLAGSG